MKSIPSENEPAVLVVPSFMAVEFSRRSIYFALYFLSLVDIKGGEYQMLL